MSALRLINETTITSGVSSVDVTDVFSADFDIYKITTNNISTVGTTGTGMDMRFIRASGSVNDNGSYDNAFTNMKGETSFQEVRGTDETNINNIFGVADQSPEAASSVIFVFNPFQTTTYTMVTSESSRTASGNYRSQKYVSVLKEADSFSGFRLFEQDTRPLNGGVIRTYGLRVDS